MSDTKQDYPCPQQEKSLPCKWSRTALRELCTNTIWVVLGKYSAILLLVGSLVGFIYNQGNDYTSDKLTVLVEQSKNQTLVNQKVLIALNEITHIKKDLAIVKKNLEDFKMEVKQRIITLDKRIK